jgi:hypothetical protein
MTVERIVALTRTYSLINPAATRRQIQALTAQLFTLTTSKPAPGATAPIDKRARLREATGLQRPKPQLWINPRLWITADTKVPSRVKPCG